MKEENVEQIVVPSYEEKPKRKGKLLIIILLLIIAVAAGLYVGFQKLNSNPKSVYKRAINETYELLDNYLKDNLDGTFKINPLEEAYSLNTSFKINTNNDELSFLNDYNYDLNIGLDYKNEIVNLNATLGNDNEKIVSLIMSYINGNAYLKSDEIFNKILNVGPADLNLDMSSIEEINQYNINYNDLHTIIYELKNILINSLDENKFSMTEETIKINNKNVDAKKVTYLLDKENIAKTNEYFKKEILNNDELINALSNIMGIDKTKIKELLEQETDFSDYEDIEINLYTKNNNIIAGNVKVDDEALVRFTYEDKKFDLYMGDDYTNLTLNYENNKLEMTYNEYDDEVFNLVFTNKSDYEEIKFTTNEYSQINTFYLKLTNIKQSTTEISTDVDFKYENNSYGEINNIELTGNLKLIKGKFDTLDTSSSVDINNLTEEEQTTIYENLLKLLEKLNVEDIYNIL